MSVRVSFEIGHKASIRTKATPEGFTHDWEVYIKGTGEHDIGHFVDKVVFLLHETFPKPKRVVKEPPYSVKESGYAGFVIPIEVYLKNKDEPKKIKFHYDLVLHQSGPDTINRMTEAYVFHNPNEEFKKKLMRGGGFMSNHSSSYAGHEERSRDSFTDERPQLMSKPKLTGEIKKHKANKHETPKMNSNFVNLFGTPIHKTTKASPDPKKILPVATSINSTSANQPTQPVKTDKKEKEKSSSEKEKLKSKYEHKEKEKKKEEKDKSKEEKPRSHKESEKIKDKPSKRSSDRPPSPSQIPLKKKCPSPNRRAPSPVKCNGIIRDEVKSQKLIEPEKKPKDTLDSKGEKDKKPKKDKKSHDKDKERKKEKEHKKDSHKVNKEQPKDKPKETEMIKEREQTNEPPPQSISKEKPQKIEKQFNKFSIGNMIKKPEPKVTEETKSKDKTESERKHKHKKKDKKRDDSHEKHKEKKHKSERSSKDPPPEPKEPPPPEPEPEPEQELDCQIKDDPGSPISLSSQSSVKSDKRAKIHSLDDITGTSDSDSDSGPDNDDDDQKFKNKPPTRPPDPPKVEVKHETLPIAVEPPEDKAGPSKEKPKKHKDKSKRSESEEKKRRKRKSSVKEEELETKSVKIEPKREGATPSGSRMSKSETKLQDNGVSSSLGEEGEEVSGAETEPEPRRDRRDATPDIGDLSPDYMIKLKELQKRIMTIKKNEDLEKVVNLIAETGRYEVTTQTFDFDLCLLDPSTVQQLTALIE